MVVFRFTVLFLLTEPFPFTELYLFTELYPFTGVFLLTELFLFIELYLFAGVFLFTELFLFTGVFQFIILSNSKYLTLAHTKSAKTPKQYPLYPQNQIYVCVGSIELIVSLFSREYKQTQRNILIRCFSPLFQKKK